MRNGLLAVGALRPEEGNSPQPVALQTTVIATGARPGDSSAKRDLFTEETQTVLVFERGAVIRLSAAVADGQLLFLSNKSTGKEVVTQVLRKRSFRPTNCYVDLEFTEPCPGFWGIEFPKAAATPSATSVAKKLADAEDSESEQPKPAAPPSPGEVERLKREVTALQTQLKSAPNTGPNAAPEAAVVAGLAPVLRSGPAGQTGVSPQPEVKTTLKISAELAKKEEEKRLEELFALEAKQEEAQAPKRLVAYPAKSTRQRAEEKASKKWQIPATVVLALAAAIFAAYRFGALDGAMKMAGLAKPALSHPAAVAPAAPAAKPVAEAPKPAPPVAAPGSPNDGTKAVEEPATLSQSRTERTFPTNPAVTVDSANVTSWKNDNSDARNAKIPSVSSSGVSGSVLTNPGTKSAISASRLHSRVAAPAGNSRFGKTQPTPDPVVKPEVPTGDAGAATAPVNSSDANSAAADADGVAAPKLIKGRKSMAPPEMIRNYITGNVNVDAVVDTTGHVRSVTVLSGPERLRATAIEQMKQYLYQPAKKNGRPVPAHVQVSLQFWYEP